MIFDRKIGFALLFAIFLETAAGLVWIGRAMDRLEQVEARMAEQKSTGERLAVLEAEMANVRETLHRMEAKLDRRGQR
jgi:uncharacterized coiled-coil protein SlyX